MRKKTKTAKIVLWILLPIVVALAVVGTELICNYNLLRSGAQGQYELALPGSASMGGGSFEEQAWDEEEDDENWDDAAAYGEEAWDEEWDDEAYAAEEALNEEDIGEELFDEELTDDEFFDESFAEEFEEGFDEEFAEEDFADEAFFEEEAAAGPVVLTVDGYVHALTIEAPESCFYTLTAELKDGTTKQYEAAMISMIEADTTIIDADVATITLPVGLNATKVTVDNRMIWNGNRMLLVGLIAACIWLLIIFADQLGKHPEYAFLCVALAVGIYMSVGLPVNVNLSYDDQTHAENIFRLSHAQGLMTKGEEEIISMTYSYGTKNDAIFHVLDTWQDEQRLMARIDEAGRAEGGSTLPMHWKFSYFGYLPEVAGVVLARTLGIGLSGQLIAARLFNMLAYVMCIFLAVRILRRFKYLMATVALMPSCMFLVSNLTYDAFGMGLCFLGIALVVDAIMDKKTKLTWSRLLGILLTLSLGAITKVVYMPLLLLVLLLPKEKFNSKVEMVFVKLMAVAVMAVGLFSMVASVAIDPSTLNDDRGDNIDSGAQIAFILAHPFTYFGYFMKNLLGHFDLYFVNYVRTNLAYVGDVRGPVSLAGLVLLVFTILFDRGDEKCRLHWYLRLGMLLIGGIAIGATFTTMYVAYSAIGSDSFAGVQARYVLPVLPLFYMLLGPDRIKILNKVNQNAWAFVWGVLALAVVAIPCWTLIMSQYFA